MHHCVLIRKHPGLGGVLLRLFDARESFQVLVSGHEKLLPLQSFVRLNAYTDWCVGRFAESLGKDQDSKEYYQRSMAYKNIWDPGVKWMRTKNSNGKWRKWDGRTGFEQGTTESNPYQQGWFVPHDVAGFAELMGEDYFVQELKTFFNKSPDDFFWNAYYNHSN